MLPPDTSSPKGEPVVISDTEDEEITPDNPEVIKNFPVEEDDTVSGNAEGTFSQGTVFSDGTFSEGTVTG